MKIQIQIDENLKENLCKMSRRTFEKINEDFKRKNNIKIQLDKGMFPIGDFVKTPALIIVSDDEGVSENTLYVSPNVKELYYKNKEKLII